MAFIEPVTLLAQGDHTYRIAQPALALADDPAISVVAGPYLEPAVRAAARCADVVVIAQVVHLDLLALVAWRRRQGLATVFEINDNFLALEAGNPLTPFFAAAGNRALALQLAAACDGLQLCTEALAARYASPRQSARVFPNQLAALSPPRPRPAGDMLWLGWGGSQAHLPEMPLLRAALQRLLAAHPRLGCALMAPPELLAALAPLPEARLRRLDPGDYAAYRRFVAGIDIGLAPLTDSPYNACRSDTKYLEYAAGGAAPVLADAEPYRCPSPPPAAALHFAGEADLVAKVGALATDPGRVRGLALAAAQHVAAQRQEGQHAQRRRDWYRQLAAAAAARAGAAPDGPATPWAAMAGAGVARRGANVAIYPLAGAARLVAAATEAGVSRADSRALLDEALALSPGDALARIYRAADPDDLARGIAEAGPEGSPLGYFVAAQHQRGPAAAASLASAWRLAPGSLILQEALGDALRDAHGAATTATAMALGRGALAQRRRLEQAAERARWPRGRAAAHAATAGRQADAAHR